MKKEVIFVLTQQFADWEMALLSAALNIGVGFQAQETPYTAKTMSINGLEVRSIGGISVMPDYSLKTLPQNFSALVLIGGFRWFDEENKALIPLIQTAKQAGQLVAGICNASIFLAVNGFLNDVKHTSNMLGLIMQHDTGHYHGQKNYLREQAVRDKNIITANGFASLEFTKEVLLALEVDTRENIERFYDFHKFGFYETAKKWAIPV